MTVGIPTVNVDDRDRYFKQDAIAKDATWDASKYIEEVANEPGEGGLSDRLRKWYDEDKGDRHGPEYIERPYVPPEQMALPHVSKKKGQHFEERLYRKELGEGLPAGNSIQDALMHELLVDTSLDEPFFIAEAIGEDLQAALESAILRLDEQYDLESYGVDVESTLDRIAAENPHQGEDWTSELLQRLIVWKDGGREAQNYSDEPGEYEVMVGGSCIFSGDSEITALAEYRDAIQRQNTGDDPGKQPVYLYRGGQLIDDHYEESLEPLEFDRQGRYRKELGNTSIQRISRRMKVAQVELSDEPWVEKRYEVTNHQAGETIVMDDLELTEYFTPGEIGEMLSGKHPYLDAKRIG
jgi:hypothetical protein